MSCAPRIQIPLPGGAHEAVESPRLRSSGPPSLPRQRKVVTPRIGVAGTVGGGDQPLIGQAAQRLIERAGRRVEASARLLLDVLADGVPVQRAVAEREKDVEGEV